MDYSPRSLEVEGFDDSDLIDDWDQNDCFIYYSMSDVLLDCCVNGLRELRLDDSFSSDIGSFSLDIGSFHNSLVDSSSSSSSSSSTSLSSSSSFLSVPLSVPFSFPSPITIDNPPSTFSLDLRRRRKKRVRDFKLQKRGIVELSVFKSGFSIFMQSPLLKFPFDINIGGVHNFTSREINLSILKFLALGQKFIFNYRSDNQAIIQSDLDDYHRRLRLKYQFLYSDSHLPSLYVPNRTYVPTKGPRELESYIAETQLRLDQKLKESFISKPLHSTFITCIKSLRLSRDDVCILRADKNLGLVLVLRSDYDNWKLDYLWNDRVYKGLEGLPCLNNKFLELESILLANGVDSTSNEAKYILQDKFNSISWGRLYFLVKVHKCISPPPLRPICSQLNTVSYFASKYVSKMLAPLVKEHVSTYFDDSIYLIQHLEFAMFDQQVVLLAADIESLYPSIDIFDCLIKVELFLKSLTCELSFNCELIMDLLKFILFNNYFEIDDLFFHQVSGVAMGTPCAVMISVIYVHMLEVATFTNIDLDRRPIFLIRYIDDYFAIFKSILDVQLFIDGFNSQHPNIKLPNTSIQVSTTENNVGVNFLDLSISQVPGRPRLRLVLYVKPFHGTHHQYIHFKSGHPRHVLKAFIMAELNRFFLRCSDREDCIRAFNNFYNILVVRNYPIAFLDPLFQRHAVSSSSEDNYKGKRLHYISCRLTSKYSRQVTNKRPVVFKRKACCQLPLKDILSPNSIVNSPSFINIFNTKDPMVVTYDYKRLGAFL